MLFGMLWGPLDVCVSPPRHAEVPNALWLISQRWQSRECGQPFALELECIPCSLGFNHILIIFSIFHIGCTGIYMLLFSRTRFPQRADYPRSFRPCGHQVPWSPPHRSMGGQGQGILLWGIQDSMLVPFGALRTRWGYEIR